MQTSSQVGQTVQPPITYRVKNYATGGYLCSNLLV
ncbi:MAG: hypothetical protein ACI8XM_001830 [Haloarculaceae archaeon]